jgi:hypothetical protein
LDSTVGSVVIEEAASEVNAPVLGVVEPIVPGEAQTPAPTEEAFTPVMPEPLPVITPFLSTLNFEVPPT